MVNFDLIMCFMNNLDIAVSSHAESTPHFIRVLPIHRYTIMSYG